MELRVYIILIISCLYTFWFLKIPPAKLFSIKGSPIYTSTNRTQFPHSETDVISLFKWAFLPLIMLGAGTKTSPSEPPFALCTEQGPGPKGKSTTLTRACTCKPCEGFPSGL